MTTRLQFYVAGVVALAAAIFGASLPSGELSGDLARSLSGVVWLVLIALGAEALALDFKAGTPAGNPTSSLAFLPFLTAVAIYSTPTAMAIIGLVCGISNFFFRRAELWRVLFNTSQGVLVGYFSSSAFSMTIERYSTPPGYFAMAVGFMALAATFFLTNMLLSSIAIALLRGSRVVTVVKQVVGSDGGNLMYDLLASPIAFTMVLLQQEHGIPGSAALMLPLLLVQYSYNSHRKVLQQSHDILNALVKAIETRDPYTSGHSERVATLARQVAIDMRLPPRRIHEIVTAALLHDIGKIHEEFVDVLRKPHALTEAERRLIETHAARGADLLATLESVPKEVVAAVRHHHERFDGLGYPDRLAGQDIPQSARIIMMCDSIDAMMSDRPYRKALSLSHVQDELAKCSGTQFDPVIVQVVLEKGSLQRAVRPTEASVHVDAEVMKMPAMAK